MRLQQRGGLSKQEISLTSFCRLLRRLGSSSVIAQSCWTTTRFFFLTWENRRKSSCSVSTSWRPPGKAGVNRYHLPGIFMTNSFRTWILAHLETCCGPSILDVEHYLFQGRVPFQMRYFSSWRNECSGSRPVKVASKPNKHFFSMISVRLLDRWK